MTHNFRSVVLAIAVLISFCASAIGDAALAAENLTVVRSNGVLDIFAAVYIGSSYRLRHSAMYPNGGAVISNDFLGAQQILNLVDAGWRDSGQQLYVRAFLVDEGLYEWVWNGYGWSGPFKLK
jgi:hypothetical protein